jgi:hypothetical protein
MINSTRKPKENHVWETRLDRRILKIGCGCVAWVLLAQTMAKCWSLLNEVMNL